MSDTDEGAAPSPKGMPKWLGAVLGVLLGAAIVGGIWFAYQAGRSAGPGDADGTAEATATVEVAEEAVEETAAEAEDVAPEETAEADDSAGGVSGGSAGSAPDAPSDVEGSEGTDDWSLDPPTDPKPAYANLRWTTIATVEGSSGRMESSNVSLADGTYRIEVNVLDGKGNPLNAAVVRVSPTSETYRLWSTRCATTGQHYTSPAQTLGAGVYKVVLAQIPSGGGTTWKVRLQKPR